MHSDATGTGLPCASTTRADSWVTNDPPGLEIAIPPTRVPRSVAGPAPKFTVAVVLGANSKYVWESTVAVACSAVGGCSAVWMGTDTVSCHGPVLVVVPTVHTLRLPDPVLSVVVTTRSLNDTRAVTRRSRPSSGFGAPRTEMTVGRMFP